MRDPERDSGTPPVHAPDIPRGPGRRRTPPPARTGGPAAADPSGPGTGARPAEPGARRRPPRRPGRPALLAAVAALVTAAACSAPAGPHRADGDAPGSGKSADRAGRGPSPEGIWRMDGYGTLVAIKGRSLKSYDITAVSCLPGTLTGTRTGAADAHGSVFTSGDAAPVSVTPEGKDRARLSLADNVGRRVLHRTDALPGRCRTSPPRDPRAVFDVFWQTYAENYPFFRAKHIDWAAVRDRHRPRVTAKTTDGELFAVLREMIEPLHDAHTRLVASEDLWFAGTRPGTVLPTPGSMARTDKAIAANLGPGVRLRHWAGGKLSYADLPGRIGYFRVTQFAGYTEKGDYAGDVAELDRALDAVFTKARTHGPAALRGLIVDLRLNGGGADPLGLRIASRLTDRPYPAYTKRARNDPHDPGKFTAPQPIRVAPHRGPAYTGPLTVLTGRLTISAGETFTQALMERTPAPVRIGENTQGVFSDTLGRTLPNGWSFALPNEEFLTSDGRTFDGAGIPPAIRTPVFTEGELTAHRDSALTRARALLAHRPPGR
ncbi:S41 family peptidase [Streptomyces sp. NPDC091266]|uniref:S41 family peptidase n=1 Tax=Streptomyces sp. NPDC091266 TaxID=3365978 RepID=UPI0037FC0231